MDRREPERLAMELGLPSLRGSEEKVRAAEAIRMSALAELIRLKNDLWQEYSEASALLVEWRTKTDARWWLDMGESSIREEVRSRSSRTPDTPFLPGMSPGREDDSA